MAVCTLYSKRKFVNKKKEYKRKIGQAKISYNEFMINSAVHKSKVWHITIVIIIFVI